MNLLYMMDIINVIEYCIRIATKQLICGQVWPSPEGVHKGGGRKYVSCLCPEQLVKSSCDLSVDLRPLWRSYLY